MESKFSYPADVAMSVDETVVFVTDRHHLRAIHLTNTSKQSNVNINFNINFNVNVNVVTLAGGTEEGERDGQVNRNLKPCGM